MKKKADLKRILLIGIPLLLLAVGVKTLDDEARVLWFERNGTDFTRARFYLFSGTKERAFDVESGDRVGIQWNMDLERGRLFLEVEPPGDGSVTTCSEPREIEFVAPVDGRVRVKVTGEKARGSYEVRWNTGSTF